MDCGPPGSSVCGILWARMREWVAISSPRGYSWPRICSAIFHFSPLRVLLFAGFFGSYLQTFPFYPHSTPVMFHFSVLLYIKISSKTCPGFWLDYLCPCSLAFTPAWYLIPVLPPIPLIRPMRQWLSHLNNKLGVFLPADHCLLFEVDSRDDSPQLLQEPPIYLPAYISLNILFFW